MKRFILAILLLTVEIFATQTDVYFANGIKTIRPDAELNTYEVLDSALMYKLGKKYQSQIHKIILAYNHTYDLPLIEGGQDLVESLLQKLSLTSLTDWFALTSSGGEEFSKHQRDIYTQMERYRRSLEDGYMVLTVAHSQGNLFTYETFHKLMDEGYTKKLYAVSVASPAMESIMGGTPRIDWDNDLVPLLKITYGSQFHNDPIKCKVRKVHWDRPVFYVGDRKFIPKSNYIYQYQLDNFKDRLYTVHEADILDSITGKYNSLVHAFTFYMGKPLKVDLENPTKGLPDAKQLSTPYKNVENGIDGSDLIDTSAKKIILDYIIAKLDKNAQIGNTDNGGGTDNGNGGDTNTGGDNSETFDYKTQCKGLKLPDNLSMIEDQINELIADASGKSTEEICQDIQDLIERLSGSPI